MSPRAAAALLGGDVSGRHILCPGPGHSPNDRSLQVTFTPQAPEGFLAHSFAGDDWAACRDHVRDRLGMPSWTPRSENQGDNVTLKPTPKPHTDDAAARSAFALAIWKVAVDPRGTLAEKYLNARGLALDADLCGRVLRFHPRCPFGPGVSVPALIAAFTPIRDGDEPQAILRIGLKSHGEKIGKMMLGAVKAAAIKLDADDDVSHGLGITEGIETALAIRAAGWRPVWALGSASTMRTLDPIPGIEALTIFADHDANEAGQAAAQACAERWADAGHEVTIYTPRTTDTDWKDALA